MVLEGEGAVAATLRSLHVDDLLAEDKTKCAPLPFSRIMFLPPSYTNVLSHLPPPPGPPPSGAHPPPPFPGAPPPPLAPGDQPGLCGLTNDQWHMVLIFSIPCKWAKFTPLPVILFHMLIMSGVCVCVCVCVRSFCSAVLIALLIVLVISRINDSEISLLWLGVQDRFKLTRMGTFPPSKVFYSAHRTMLTESCYRLLSVALTSIHPK